MSEYQALTPARKLLERIYRSGWGSCLYYLIEMWWLRMFFPSERYMGSRRAEFRRDSAFVAVTGALWIGALVFIAAGTGQSALALVGFGFVVPFLLWNALIGFVVYVHYTHTNIQWYQDKRAWARSAPFVSTTVHLIFPYRIGGLFHHIMEHTTHHVDMSILYTGCKARSRYWRRHYPRGLASSDSPGAGISIPPAGADYSTSTGIAGLTFRVRPRPAQHRLRDCRLDQACNVTGSSV